MLFRSIKNKEYNEIEPYPHFSMDDILPEEFAKKCQEEILNIPSELWDRYDNPFEQKFTLRDKNNLPENCRRLFEILTSDEIINSLSNITQVNLINDSNKNWWGIHTYKNGDYLDIHSDAGNHPITKQKKHLTLGIYLSYNWKEENGGYLEIWDGDNVLNDNAKVTKCYSKILPLFNKLIIFTNKNNEKAISRISLFKNILTFNPFSDYHIFRNLLDLLIFQSRKELMFRKTSRSKF